MKYVMLIYQGDALERQAALPEEERKQVDADPSMRRARAHRRRGVLFSGVELSISWLSFVLLRAVW